MSEPLLAHRFAAGALALGQPLGGFFALLVVHSYVLLRAVIARLKSRPRLLAIHLGRNCYLGLLDLDCRWRRRDAIEHITAADRRPGCQRVYALELRADGGARAR
jgi:hypothetical protein